LLEEAKALALHKPVFNYTFQSRLTRMNLLGRSKTLFGGVRDRVD
jgi:hypothetical protein